MDRQPWPHTVASLSADLRALGVGAGDVVLLHASRRNVGFVAGGTQAIVHAFLDVLASTGTLVVPTHTPENTDPAMSQKPPVHESWWRVIREQSPGFEQAKREERRREDSMNASVRRHVKRQTVEEARKAALGDTTRAIYAVERARSGY